MAIEIDRARQLLIRGLRLKCPTCGQAPLFESLFKTYDRCTGCGLAFSREQGYFVGAIYINVVATESAILLVYLLLLLFLPAASEIIYTILFMMAGILPLAFFHHSRSLWLAIDHLIDPPFKSSSSQEAEPKTRQPFTSSEGL